MKIYLINNLGRILNYEFSTRKEAEDWAKWNISNHPEVNWKDIYKIIEEDIEDKSELH